MAIHKATTPTADDLHIEIVPDMCAVFRGTADQLAADGLLATAGLPVDALEDFPWPAAGSRTGWTSRGLVFELSPLGPDCWYLQVAPLDNTGEYHKRKRAREAGELARLEWQATAEGRRVMNEQRRRARAAARDEAFQRFRADVVTAASNARPV